MSTPQLEPWRCDSCRQLMYNLDGGYPSPGAPEPSTFDSRKLCAVCYAMALCSDINYFRELDKKRKELYGTISD